MLRGRRGRPRTKALGGASLLFWGLEMEVELWRRQMRFEECGRCGGGAWFIYGILRVEWKVGRQSGGGVRY